MELMFERVAALDLAKASLTACVRTPGPRGGRRSTVRTFSTTVGGLLILKDWLVEEAVEVVSMESTGVYWKPPYYLLEADLTCWVLNAQQVKTVPGRKSDVRDAEWLAQLTECGLVRPSFVPPPPIRELRNLTRYRSSLVRDRTRETQRLEKLMEDTGIKLSSVVSSLLTKSGRLMLEALVAGERDPLVLAELAQGKLRGKRSDLAQALVGRFTDHHALLVTQMLARIDSTAEAITAIEAAIDTAMRPFSEPLTRLQTIPGVGPRIAQIIIAETGGDMSRFPSAAHLASWAGLVPGINQSAKRRGSTRCRHGNRHLASAMVEAARAASHTKDTYAAAQYWRLTRRGPNKAAVAVAHSLLVAVWHVLAKNCNYDELGGDYYQRRLNPERRTRTLVAQLEALGHHVELTPAA
jgi:transposase